MRHHSLEGRINWKLVFLSFLVVLVLVQLFIYPLNQYVQPEQVKAILITARWLGPLLLIVLNIVRPLTLLPVPTLSIAAGVVFGPVLGGLYTYLGILVAAVGSFWLARYFGHDYMERRFKKLMHNRFPFLDRVQRKEGFKTVLLLRFIPVVPFDLLNYTAGLSEVNFRDFLFATMIGVVPGIFAYTYLGSSLYNWRSAKFIGALIFIGLLGVVPLIYERWKNRKRT